MKQQNILMLFYNTFTSLSHLHLRQAISPRRSPGPNGVQVLQGGRFSRESVAVAPWRHNLLAGRGIASLLSPLAMTLFFTACVPLNRTPSTATPIPTNIAPPTQTIAWFPPSATSTRRTIPSYTPMPDMSPGLGRVILSDNFADDSPWDTAVSDQGSAILSRNRLTLAVQPGIYLSSLRREPAFGNFYSEITAHTSLCRGEDNYGLIVRAGGSSFYRYVLSCNGFIHVERINNGTKLIIYNAVASGDAPLGAPGEVRIEVWAVGREMRLFLNGRFQFNIIDKSFPNGVLGVFVRSQGDTPVAVTFSDLTVYDVDYVAPTRTPLP